MQKAKWYKPQVNVLVRGRPEEAVLSGCKGTALTGTGTTRRGCKSGSQCATTACSNALSKS